MIIIVVVVDHSCYYHGYYILSYIYNIQYYIYITVIHYSLSIRYCKTILYVYTMYILLYTFNIYYLIYNCYKLNILHI
jgi:hypothetical protein